MTSETTTGIDPRLLPQLLSLKDDEVILPLKLKREDVNRLRAVKLADDEVERVQTFQTYLKDRGYIPEDSFASLFVYCYNLAYTLHKRAADQEADKEVDNAG